MLPRLSIRTSAHLQGVGKSNLTCLTGWLRRNELTSWPPHKIQSLQHTGIQVARGHYGEVYSTNLRLLREHPRTQYDTWSRWWEQRGLLGLGASSPEPHLRPRFGKQYAANLMFPLCFVEAFQFASLRYQTGVDQYVMNNTCVPFPTGAYEQSCKNMRAPTSSCSRIRLLL